MKKITLFFLALNFPLLLVAQKTYDLPEVPISAARHADTVFGTWKFSVSDYEFPDQEHLVLLTYTKDPANARIVLTDAAQHIIADYQLPEKAKSLYKDYMGFVNVICQENVYRITLRDGGIHLSALPANDYMRLIMPCIDTIRQNLYFSDYDPSYPEFTYYSYKRNDSVLFPLRVVADREALQGYNMEFYFLKPKERVQCLKYASYYGVDKHRIAAAMSGLTSSDYYSPLYAPLFVINDTAVVFDHCSDAILRFDEKEQLVDSVHIDYNHPKNWRDWKHKIIVDDITHEAYALYGRNGFSTLKKIDLKTGKICGTYKILNQGVAAIKIRNGYVYYVYSPFESLQEFFVYKELISF